MNNPNENSHQHQQQSQPLINPNELPSTSSDVSAQQTSHHSRVSQLVNNVNLSNLIRSNSFLHSDLGNFIEISPQSNITTAAATTSSAASATTAATPPTTSGISPAGSTMATANSAQVFAGGAHTHAHSHSHSHNNTNPTVVDIQGI
jgi:hypothetical protein